MTPDIISYVKALTAADKKTLTQKALKLCEEAGELAKAVLPHEGTPTTLHRFVTKERVLEESIDVLLCALSIAFEISTDDEIESMIMRKARYWQELQSRENKIEFPIPYEIHVTVSPGEEGIDIPTFKESCQNIGVKPLLIDLHNQSGRTVMFDAQTSSTLVGDNTDAMNEADRIARSLTEDGFKVVRKKIETVPWHPAAPSKAHANPTMPKDCYFESHFNVVVNNQKDASGKYLAKNNYDVLKDGIVKSPHPAHLSRNTFKKITDDAHIMMVTHRAYSGCYEDFTSQCAEIATYLVSLGFEVPKTITEFSVFDTKISHDAVWFSN